MRSDFRINLETTLKDNPRFRVSPVGIIAQLMLKDDCFTIAILAELMDRSSANVTRWFRTGTGKVGNSIEQTQEVNEKLTKIAKIVRQCHMQDVTLCVDGKLEILRRLKAEG